MLKQRGALFGACGCGVYRLEGFSLERGFPNSALLAFGARELSVVSFSPLRYRVFSSIPGLCLPMPVAPPPSDCSLRQPKHASYTHCQMSPGGGRCRELTVENHHIRVMGIEAPLSLEGLPDAASCRSVLWGRSVL